MSSVHTTGIYSKYKMVSAGYKAVEEDMQQYLDRGMNITILRPTMIFGDLCDHNISKFIRSGQGSQSCRRLTTHRPHPVNARATSARPIIKAVAGRCSLIYRSGDAALQAA